VQTGERRIGELFEKYGAGSMKTAMNWAMDYSEQLMRAEIEKIPDGTYVFEDYLDNDGIDKDRRSRSTCESPLKAAS